MDFTQWSIEQCRTYEDFEYAMKFKYSEDEVTEMDTVKGVRESGKRFAIRHCFPDKR